MFSVRQKREIADKVQAVLRETNHPELPDGEIEFSLHVKGGTVLSWADIQNNGQVTEPSINPHNEAMDIVDGISLVLEERKRQIEVKGWSVGHDIAEHQRGELEIAAACYAVNKTRYCSIWVCNKNENGHTPVNDAFPFSPKWDKREKTTPLRSKIKAAALLIASIDRDLAMGVKR